MITKEEAFYFTLNDLSNGCTIEDMRFILKDYEEREEYEACAGIYLAIEIQSFSTLTNVVKLGNELFDFKQKKFKLTFDGNN